MANKVSKWERVWDIQKFDDLFNRDERFFSVLIKGMIGWLNSNIVLYGKQINHFFHVTGSSYLYVENNGYYYSSTETTGEDYIYMQMPRCIIELGGINIPTEELSSAFAQGIYERKDGNDIRGFSAQMRRVPIELDINLKYVLSNFNESIVLAEEIISKILFQRYFKISFLGQIIDCSIEFPQNFNIEINHVDMTEPTTNQKNVQLSVKICTNYPAIDQDSEIPTDKIISSFKIGSSHIDPIVLKNNNGESVEINVDENGKLVLQDGSPLVIDETHQYFDEMDNQLNTQQIINKLVDKTKLTEHSTLFFGDISNTVDIISKDKILK